MKENYKLIYKTKDNKDTPMEKWRIKLFEILNKIKSNK